MTEQVDKEDKKKVNLSEQEGAKEDKKKINLSEQKVESVLTDVEVKELAKDLLIEDKSVSEVMRETGLSFEVVRGLKGVIVREKKREVKKTKDELEEKATIQEEKESSEQEKNKSIPYEEVEPADVFLRNFLSEFDFKEQFIDLLCRRVKRRNALPYPNDLAADIQDMPSGITNPKSANYIAEEYSYVLKDYEKRLKSTNKLRGSMGYAVDLSESHDTGHDGSHGISLDRYKGDDGQVRDVRRDREGQTVEKTSVDPIKEVRKRYRSRKAEYLEELMDVKEIADMERELDGGKEKQEEEIKRLREENQRLREGDGHRNDPNSEMRERITKLEDDIRQRDADRMQRLDDDLKAARNTPLPQQNPGSLNSEEVSQLVGREIDARTKNVTIDDVERVAQRVVGNRVALTKDDLVYMESRDKFHLEEKKLDESGKTRDVIGNAITDGFKRFGNIVGRMMTGEGETTGIPVDGYTDQAGEMMQIACLDCKSVITAPVGSPAVVCPGCGKRWTVERRPPQQQQMPPQQPPQQQPIPPQPPKTEQIPPKTEQIPPKTEQIPPKTEETVTPKEKVPEQTSDAPAILPETSDAPAIIPEQTSDVPKDVEKIAESIAIGAATDELEKKVEGELKKEIEPVVQKMCPKITSNICPIPGCNKKCRTKGGVGLHVDQVHPEYKR